MAPDVHEVLMMRTAGDPDGMEEMVRRLLQKDNLITVKYVESMPELMGHQVALRQFSMRVAVAFGALALLLAVFGTYGLLAYEVSLREREIGIRACAGVKPRRDCATTVATRVRGGLGAGL